MGDTGSLALGGALAGLAILTRTELLLIILGGLFVMETVSVMMQVGFFKLSKGKRIFRMAPVHHHFEMLGWEQVTVVVRFWIITGLCVAARSDEHTSEIQSLMRISYAVFCLQKKQIDRQ